jgi:hypothetical protein
MDIVVNPGGTHHCLTDQIGAALDWWRDAGVDSDFADIPLRWIEPELAERLEEPSVGAAAKPSQQAPPEIERSNWPHDFESFAHWWLAELTLDDGQVVGRVAPRGMHRAPLMVLVAEPEREDSTQLLSGPQGRLLAGMLASMGLAPELVYIASVLPRHTPHADWNAAAARGLGELACHHVTLAAPERLIVFGSNILPLLGHDPANFAAGAAQFAHGDIALPMLAARDLAVLLERPRWKAGFWANWLDWNTST